MGNAGSSMGLHVPQMHLCFTVDPHAAASPWLHHGLQRNKSLLQHLEHIFLEVCRVVALTYSHPSLPPLFCSGFSPLTMLSQMCCHPYCWIWPAAYPPGIGLGDTGEASGASHRNHPLFPHYLNLAMQTQSTSACNISKNMQMQCMEAWSLAQAKSVPKPLASDDKIMVLSL